MIDYPETYYGSYRTRTFAEIFPNSQEFADYYNEAEIPTSFSNTSSINTLYYLLYARYGNSHIAASDENRFKYAVLSTIFMYGPAWEKRLDIQRKLIALNEEEMVAGGKAIYNSALNPEYAPSTNALTELPYINSQNTTNYKKSKIEGYATILSLIETDVTKEFIDRFAPLFIKSLAYDEPLLYTQEVSLI